MKVRQSSFVLLLLVLACTAVGLGQIIWLYRDYPFFFDEAIHANGGLALSVDLWNQDIFGFLQTFYRQGFYPPAFSVPKGIAFYLFGASTVVARGFSLFCLVLGQLVIFFFVQDVFLSQGKVSQKAAGWVGLVAILLTLTSLPLLNASTHVMMEAPGLLISFVFLWLYGRSLACSDVGSGPTYLTSLTRSEKRWLAVTGLVLMLVFLTKYTYGMAMIGTVAVMELSLLDWGGLKWGKRGALSAVFDFIRPVLPRWLWLVGPFVLCLVLWLGTPYKLGEFLGYATAQPHEAEWSWDALLFYPRNILLQQLPSPLFGAVSLLGLVWGFQNSDRPEVRLLLIYFLVGMLEMLLNFPKIPRFVVTFLPAAHILTGLMLVSAFSGQWPVASRPVGYSSFSVLHWLLAALLGASLVWAGPVLYVRYSTINSLMSSQLKTAPAVNEIPLWVDEQIPDGSRFYIVNYFELVNAQSLAWGHIAHATHPIGPFMNYEMPGSLLAEPTGENVARFRQSVLDSGAEFVLVIEGGDWGRGWPAYERQLQDLVQYHAHQEFRVEVVNRPTDILWNTAVDRSVAEYVLEHERGMFHLKLLVYRVQR